MTAQAVARLLERLGIVTQGYCEPDGYVYGEVVLSPMLHVQVGEGYLVLMMQLTPHSYHAYPARMTPEQVLEDIRHARGTYQ